MKMPYWILLFLTITVPHHIGAEALRYHTDYEATRAVIAIEQSQDCHLTAQSERNEVIIRSECHVDFEALAADLSAHDRWIAAVTFGYDTLVFRLHPGHVAEVTSETASTVVTLSLPQALEQDASGQDEPLGIQIATARLTLEDHDNHHALQMLYSALESHPTNTEVMIGCAQAELQSGRPIRALSLLHEAQRLGSDHATLTQLLREINWAYDPYIGIEREQLYARGESMVQRTQFIAEAMLCSTCCSWTKLRGVFAHSDTKVKTLQDVDGSISGFDVDRDVVTLQLDHRRCCGTEWLGSLYLGDFHSGIGGTLEVRSPYSRGWVQGRFDLLRPEWNYIGSVVHRGTRTGLEASVLHHPNRSVLLSAGAGLRHYRADNWGKVADTFAASGNITYLIRNPNPTLRVAYSIDAEYGLDENERVDINGQKFNPFLFASREVHSLIGLISFEDPNLGDPDHWYIEGYGGYAHDRLGSGGPSVGIRGLLRFLCCWELSGELQMTINSTGGGGGQNELIRGFATLRRRY